MTGALKVELEMICLLWVLGPQLQSFLRTSHRSSPRTKGVLLAVRPLVVLLKPYAFCSIGLPLGSLQLGHCLDLTLVLFRRVTTCSAWKELNIGTHVL